MIPVKRLATSSASSHLLTSPARYTRKPTPPLSRPLHQTSRAMSKHPDFSQVQASRPDWDEKKSFEYHKTRDTAWKWGDGANDHGEGLKKNHIEIDPYEEGRPSMFNYKLLISGIVPRPIGFISTTSKDGSSTNLSPFSYFSVVNHDPPIFTVGFVGGIDGAKDSLKNLVETGDCVINIISEHFIEAANSTSVDSPYGVSEWALSGLTPAPCSTVKASRVKEAIFAVEGKLVETKEFESRAKPGKKSGCLAIIEGTRFWAREDAINEEKSVLDTKAFRPVYRVGGITYGRVSDGFEIPRPRYNDALKEEGVESLVKPKVEGQ